MIKGAPSPKWIECGRVGRPWGIKGYLTVDWMSGACPVEAGRGEVFTRDADGQYVPHLVLSSRQKGHRFVVSFRGLQNPKDASVLTNKKLYIPEDALPNLSRGEFYCYQILGLQVITEDGKVVGEVVKIFSAGSNDIYEVKPKEGQTILIPAINSVIVSIDIEKGRIIIRPMEGMLD